MPGAIPRQNAGASCANGTSNPARKPALYALSTSEVVPIPFIPMMRPNSTRKGPLSLQPTDIAILGNALSASTVRKPMALNGQRVTDLFEPTLSDHNNRCLSSADVPLAERLRPTALSDVLGQDHLLGPNAPIGRMLAAGRLSSIVFRSEEHTSELQSLMRISSAVFCLKKQKHNYRT